MYFKLETNLYMNFSIENEQRLINNDSFLRYTYLPTKSEIIVFF